MMCQLQITNNIPELSTYLFVLIVVVAIALFFYFLKRTDKIIEKEKLANPSEKLPMPQDIINDDVHEELAAAIAMALDLYQRDLHDKESFTITMQKVSRIYSPWSSKIYTLRQNPQKR